MHRKGAKGVKFIRICYLVGITQALKAHGFRYAALIYVHMFFYKFTYKVVNLLCMQRFSYTGLLIKELVESLGSLLPNNRISLRPLRLCGEKIFHSYSA